MNGEGPSYTGRVLGDRYLVGERLGRGAFGTVYACTQRDLGRPVAIKVLHLDVALSGDAAARFEREARAAAALGHPNIVQVTDFSARPGEPPFLVMEMLPGMTLGEAIRRAGRLPAARVAFIAHQMLAALDAAHRAGIVHRDVKPDNVFLVSSHGVEDFVKLLDFGIAKLDAGGPSKLTKEGAFLGSPAYMAPEQIKGGMVDPRTDLYAVGATMYQALSGRLPFDADSMHALLYAITETTPTPLGAIDSTIDPRIAAIVARAMQRDPAMRFGSAGEMRAALDPWVARGAPGPTPMQMSVAAPITAPPPPYVHASAHGHPTAQVASQVSMAPRPIGKTIAAVVAAMVGLVLIVGAGVLAFLLHDADPTGSTPAAAPSLSATAPEAATATATAASSEANAAPTAQSPGGARTASPGPLPKPSPPKPAIDAGGARGGSDGGTARKQMAGTDPDIRGGVFGDYDIAKTKDAIRAVMPAIRRCYVLTEYDPPDHQFTVWVLTVDATGTVKGVRRKTGYQLHPVFDACIVQALRTARLPAVPGGGEPEIHLTARTRDNP